MHHVHAQAHTRPLFYSHFQGAFTAHQCIGMPRDLQLPTRPHPVCKPCECGGMWRRCPRLRWPLTKPHGRIAPAMYARIACSAGPRNILLDIGRFVCPACCVCAQRVQGSRPGVDNFGKVHRCSWCACCTRPRHLTDAYAAPGCSTL